jgi:hypothetical protein
MLVPASGASVEALTEALLEFTLQAPNLTRLHTDIIRAIAVLLTQADHELKAQRIAETTTKYLTVTLGRLEKVAATYEASSNAVLADQLTDQLKGPLSAHLANHIALTLSPQIVDMTITTGSLAATLTQVEQIRDVLARERQEKDEGIQMAVDRLEESAYALYSNVQDCENTIKLLSPSLETTQSRLNTLSLQLAAQNSPTTITTHPPPLNTAQHTRPTQQSPSYSDIAATHLPPMVDQAVARASIRARQILLEPKLGNSVFPRNSSNPDIAAIINNALSKIRKDSTPAGELRAVQVQCNGSLVIELENENIAGWLRSPNGRAALESQLDLAVTVRDRTHPIVVQYLPIYFNIEQENFLRQVERENTLPINSLDSIRWIKPPHRRSNEQSKAFALIQVCDAAIANNILREGICIDKNRFSVHKDKKEPIRCAKCQHYGHIARNCSAQADTCGTCGGHHRTADCTAARTQYCVSCRSHNHASWSRSCPELTKRSAALDEKLPENKMPYFPTPTPWTQIIHPPKPSSTRPPPANSRTASASTPTATATPPRSSRQTRTMSPPLLPHASNHATHTQTTLPYLPQKNPPTVSDPGNTASDPSPTQTPSQSPQPEETSSSHDSPPLTPRNV